MTFILDIIALLTIRIYLSISSKIEGRVPVCRPWTLCSEIQTQSKCNKNYVELKTELSALA